MVLVYLYLVLVYIRPQDWVPSVAGLPLNEIIGGSALMIGFMNALRKRLVFPFPFAYLILGYLVAIILSSLNNHDLDFSTFILGKSVKILLIFFLIIWNVDTNEKAKNVMIFLLFLTIILSIQAIEQGVTGIGWGNIKPVITDKEPRVIWMGTWDGPNVYGILFVLAIPICLGFLLHKNTSIIYKIFNMVFLILMITALYYTKSRGAFLGLICSVIFFFRVKMLNPKIAIATGIIMVVFISVISSTRMGEISSSESSAHERTYLWEQGLDMLRGNPLLGVGKASFSKYSHQNLISHNNYVQCFSETGLIGFYFFMGLIWYSFKGLYLIQKDKNKNINGNKYFNSNILISMMIGFCSATFFVVLEDDLMFVLFGLCTATYLTHFRENNESDFVKFGIRDNLAIVTGMASIILMVWLAAVKKIL